MITISQVTFGEAEQRAVCDVLASGNLAQGREVAWFEDEFADWVDRRSCVAVNSGTSALHVGLLALGIRPGDEVIVPSFTFAATANAVVLAGGTPVFADIDPLTFCLDPDAVAAAVTSRTVGVMPVHLYGHMADLTRILAVADASGLWVFEDAAQAHGAFDPCGPSGARGDLAAYSFYATKNMTTGEGGMLVTASEEHADRARMFRNQGMQETYRNEVVGLNNRMTDLAAAIGRVQLRRLPDLNRRRRANAAFYDERLTGVEKPVELPGFGHVYHQYTVRTSDRDGLQSHLADGGVQARVYYPVPVHRLPSFLSAAELPETARACAEVLSLPVHPGLSEADLTVVTEAVDEWMS